MKAWYASLQPRQQRLVAIGGLVAVLALLLTVVREGVFGRDLDLAWFSADRKWSISSNSGTTGSATGDGPAVAFSGRETTCSFSCTGDSAICEGFQSGLQCKAEQSGAVHLLGAVTFPETPFCYTPLIKTSLARFDFSMSASLKAGSGSKSGTYTAHGEVDQTVKGFMSCTRFKRELGKLAANAIGGDVNAFLRKN